VREDLGRREYVAKTRGRRTQLEARPAAAGRCAVGDHGGHTHLAYALELPREPGDVQCALNIRREASFIIAVRNPDAPAPAGTGLDPRCRARLPTRLQERFRGQRSSRSPAAAGARARSSAVAYRPA
jgi:hypothetical protein